MRVQRTVLRGLLLAAVAFAFDAPARAATTIGLYSDSNGSSCSFSGNQSGVVNAYVVVKPDNVGITGVRFSAPIPGCFGGTWVTDIKAFDTAMIGDSPSDISVAFSTCSTEPRLVLQIQYLRTSTTACCPFSIQPSFGRAFIEATNCSFVDVPITGVTSHFNANASCPCSDVTAPHPVSNPSPADNAILVSVNTGLSWSPSPLDGDIVSYDVYFGTTNPPSLVATVTSPAYQPPQPLVEGTRYYWEIVVRDNEGYTAAGPFWTFLSRADNYPPETPSRPNPSNNEGNVSTGVHLSWLSSDLDNDPLKYDVYFGTASPPPLVASNLTVAGYVPQGLQLGTQYHWRVVARDPHAETSGPEWVFTTRSTNSPPYAPSNPSPTNLFSVSVSTNMSWSGGDPDGDQVRFDVYLGTTDPPPLAVQNIATFSYKPASPLAFATNYYWRVVARDQLGAETSGPVWHFVTTSNQPPATPSNPSPANNANGIWLNSTLTWTSSDEYPGLRYDVYYGTANPPPLVASDYSSNSYSVSNLMATTTYHWKIVARDAQGLTNVGPLWTFYTASAPVPTAAFPPDGGLGANPLSLTWTANRPNGQTPMCDLYFGTTNPPPLVASGLQPVLAGTAFAYTPGVNIVPGTKYYWSVYAFDSVLGSMGPTWSFTGALRGDINNDGTLTVDDASCALRVAVGDMSCAPPGGTNVADVNCSLGVSPRDALCIHRRAIGQTCPFCGDSQTTGTALTPVVTRTAYFQDGNVVHAVLAVGAVPALEAFSFSLRTPTNAALTSAIRRGATGNFTALEIRSTSTAAQVGGYSLTPADATFSTDFIELTFTVSGSLTGFIVAEGFTDDLLGAGTVTIVAGNGKGGGGGLPVTFSRFDATVADGGVRIAWQMHFTAAAGSFTLFRHEDGKPTVTLASGEIQGESGSYLDRTVEVGRKYRYEMLVHTLEGDDLRSPLAGVTVPSLGLALSPNHPNPFNPQTTIPYYVPAGAAPVHVRLTIFDTSGRAVRVLVDENQAGGARDVVWRGDDETGKTVSSGIYFCVLQVGSERRTQKLVLLK